jgi:hypothetical protein
MSKTPNRNKLLEAMAASHLSRIFRISYVKKNKGVYITVRYGDELVGFKLEFSKVKKMIKSLGKMKKVFVLSKDTLDEGIIPVSLFLAMLNIPQVLEITI